MASSIPNSSVQRVNITTGLYPVEVVQFEEAGEGACTSDEESCLRIGSDMTNGIESYSWNHIRFYWVAR